jgi:16S rRNA (cytosine967-C5)-methyltransferase
MRVTLARRIAYEVLRRVEAEGAYAGDLLHARLGEDVKAADAALATELTLGVLRWRRQLDFILRPLLKKPVEQLDLPVAIALRMGVYQICFLRKVPARAAVNESVEILKVAKKASAAPLVNAVLRRVAEGTRRTGALLDDWRGGEESSALAERLGILHSHPTWMVERWLERFGETRTVALLETNNRAPRLSCMAHGPAERDEVITGLEKTGLRVETGSLLREAFSVSGGSATRTEAFRKGWISIQDEASQAVPLLLGARPGERVLDLCAAPGGKTALLARAVGDGGLVIAGDRHAHRLRAMREQIERLGLTRVVAVELDAEKPLPFGPVFQRILVDVPCSGTGTLARHPEIRWRLQREQLKELHGLQVALLKNAIELLAPGGRLVYSTCSMEPEENEDVVAEALRLAGPAVQGVSADEVVRTLAPHFGEGVSAADVFDGAGTFRTWPPHFQVDGFFAVAIEREGQFRSST